MERFPTKKKIRPINRDREMFGHIERIGTTVLPKTTILKESVTVKPGVLLLRKLLVPSNLLILVADQGQQNYILSYPTYVNK